MFFAKLPKLAICSCTLGGRKRLTLISYKPSTPFGGIYPYLTAIQGDKNQVHQSTYPIKPYKIV